MTDARQAVAAERGPEASTAVREAADRTAPERALSNQAVLRRNAVQPERPPASETDVLPDAAEQDVESDLEPEIEEDVQSGKLAPGRLHQSAPPASDPPPAAVPPPPAGAGNAREATLAAAVHLARQPGGTPLPAAIRSPLERSFACDLTAVRLHHGPSAAVLTSRIGARAVTLGRDVFLNDAAIRDGPDALGLLAHEVAHAVQQELACDAAPLALGERDAAAEQEAEDAAWLVRLGLPVPSLRSERAGTLRRDGPTVTAASGGAIPVSVASPAVITAFIANPPIFRMSATLEGLFFTTEDRGQVDFPDNDLAPTAGVFARLCDTHYAPQLVRDFQATPERISWIPPRPDSRRANTIRLLPSGASDVLAFLDRRLGADQVAITAHQRSIMLTGLALNPIPPQFLEAIRSSSVVIGGGGLEIDGVLGGNQAMVRQLATMWWTKTQAYVLAWQAWRATPNGETLTNASFALDDLMMEFTPYSRLLTGIYQDAALQPLPEWQILWPNAHDGTRRALDSYSQSAAADFVLFASSQPRQFLRLARTDAAARRSLLLGFAAMRRGAVTPAAGDQSVSAVPSPYNAPALDMRINSYPPLLPPSFGMVLGSTTTFFSTIQFMQFADAVSRAFGGWFYDWDYVRVPNDDPAMLGLMSIPPSEASEWDALSASLRRDLRYADEDLQRFNTVQSMAMQLGAPGMGPETLVGFNLLMDMAGSVAKSTFAVVAGRPSEYRITPSEPGLYIARCTAGPRLDDTATFAQFRRQPSTAWMPFWALSADQIARDMLREDSVNRNEAEREYRRLLELLSTSSQPNDAALREDLERLRLSLYGTGPELLQAQLRELELRQTEIRATGVTRSDELTGLARQIADINLMIAMRNDRAGIMRGQVLRLPATLVKDDGTAVGLLLEVAKHNPHRALWHVSDVTTPQSGLHDPVRGDGTLAPEYDNEDAILATIKALLESESGYGRGRLAVQFPPNLDRTDQTSGNLRTIRIATDATGIVIRGVENITTLVSIAAVVAAPFTGGASLVLMLPVGIVGALPSAYRLVHRHEMGTLRNDLNTWLAVVDIVGAVLNLGEIGAGARAAARAGTVAGLRWAVMENGLWIAGMAGNGLGLLLMTGGMMQQLEALRGLPPGVAAARSLEIIGQAMLSLGIQAGAHLASARRVHSTEEGLRSVGDTSGNRTAPPVVDTAVDVTAPGGRPAGWSPASAELASAVPSNLHVPLDVAPVGGALAGNTVRVVFRRSGATGRVDANSIRVQAGHGASHADIAAHMETVRTLREYAGALGAVLDVTESLRLAVSGTRRPQQGSAAWEAQLELAKLPPIIERRMRELRGLTNDDPRRLELEADIVNLMDQVNFARSVVSGLTSADPRGIIEARSVEQLRTDNLAAISADSIMVVTRSGDQWVATSAEAVSAGGVDPIPGHYIFEQGGRPVVRGISNRTGSGEAHFRLLHEGGQWYLVPNEYGGTPIRRPDSSEVTLSGLARDMDSRLARAAAASPHTAASFPVLEGALSGAGLPVESPVRPLLRNWGNLLNQLDVIRSQSEGMGLPTSHEIATQASAILMRGSTDGTVIQARIDDFRRFVREQALAAIFGIPQADLARGTRADGTPLSARPSADQLRYYRAMIERIPATDADPGRPRLMPEPGDIGELWTRYRDIRSRLPADGGGIAEFRPLAISTRRLVHTTTTEIDGAITVSTQMVNGPPPGNYGMESKGGGSIDHDQAGRYSTNITDNGGRMVLDDGRRVRNLDGTETIVPGTSLSGVVYMCDNETTARRTRDHLDTKSLHPNMFVLYLDIDGRLKVMPREVHRLATEAAATAAAATPTAPAAGVTPTSGPGTGTGTAP
jgi:Domain of unknown function (DUF4157)